MPTGVVIWFDQKAGKGIIRRNGREYPVHGSDIESAAQVPSAPVHFDIKRERGVERAVSVTLRRGTRVGPRQHRFGDLAGAHHPDEKGHHPLTDDHPGLDPAFEGRPVALIEEWSRLFGQHDSGTLRLLYAPDAVLRTGADVIRGRDEIVDKLWDVLPELGRRNPAVHESGGVVRVELGTGRHTEFDVAHGKIIEQRF